MTFRNWMLGLATTCLLACSGSPEDRKPVVLSQDSPKLLAAVNPFVGTGGHGHTFPGATYPFGGVQLSPDTRLEGWDGCSGYHYSDSIVYGFSHTHLSGTGVSDYGDILFMPLTGTPHTENGYPDQVDAGYASRFSHDREQAEPGYYQVFLDDYGIQVELTASERGGMHRYDFGQQRSGSVVVDLRHRDLLQDWKLELFPDRVEGYRISKAWAEEQHVYFSASFSQISSSSIDIKDENGAVVGYLLNFEDLEGPLEIRVGISAVDVEGARKNREAELRSKSFKTVRKNAEAAWREYLGKIEIAGGTEAQRRTFYSALYHTAIAPNVFSDVDGRYRGLDGEVHRLPEGQRHYTVFSLWDTFRATHPLYNLIAPERNEAFIRTFLRQYQEGGRLPIWELAGNYTGCMIGYHAIPVITDTYVKGYRDFDAELALEAMVHSADLQWLGLEAYQQKGFIGAGDEPESVSKTLEYAFDDWCIAVLADSLGKKEIADRFYKRCLYYRNLFDQDTEFFRARMNGGWQEPFDPREVNFNFTEANAWQYSTFVPHDLAYLDKLHGGDLDQHLDQMFTAEVSTTGREQADITGLIGQYAHGNEPSHHAAYLYSVLGRSPEAQRRVRQIMDELYSDAPDGLSGNEDCGQMSAWYVFSAMGFYPVTPGSDNYIFGTPLFPSMKLHLGDTALVINAPGADEGNILIHGVTLNGEPIYRPWIHHDELAGGGVLEFEMGDKPKNPWPNAVFPLAARPTTRPPVPVIQAASQTFTDSLAIQIIPQMKDVPIYYQLNGSEKWVNGTHLVVREDAHLKVVASLGDDLQSPELTAHFYKKDQQLSIDLGSTYDNQYAAGGDGALIDGLRGGPNFRTGRWQGYRDDFEAIIDIGTETEIRAVQIGFLQDIRSWIWMPKEVEIATSVDGKQFNVQKKGGLEVPDDDETVVTQDFEVGNLGRGRYVRVRARQYGVCPPWHLGAGGKTWIFTDEILIDYDRPLP